MSWVQGVLNHIRTQEPGVKVYVDWYPRNGLAVLSMLNVPEERRGQGVARRIVSALVEAADIAGARLAVTPTNEFGADLPRLRRFYESYGFIRNTGGHRDWHFKEDYIRPQGGAS